MYPFATAAQNLLNRNSTYRSIVNKIKDASPFSGKYSRDSYERKRKKAKSYVRKVDKKYGDIRRIDKDIRVLKAQASNTTNKTELSRINKQISDLTKSRSMTMANKNLTEDGYNRALNNRKKAVRSARRNSKLLTSGNWVDDAQSRKMADKENRRLEKLERKKEKAYEKHGITTTEALTSMFKREKDLTGLRGKPRRDAKRYNKRLQLLKQKNDDTFGKVKEHIGNNLGAYGLGAAALLGGGALLANNAHKRNMIKMAYNNQMARRNANYKLIGDIAGSVISGMRGGQQPYLGGAGVYGYNPYQQQQQPKKRSLVGSVARAAASNPALAQVALGAASKFMK